MLEQNYRNDPISQELLLSFYEGKTIDFLVQRADKQEIINGKIVRSGYIPSSYYAQNYQQPSSTQPIIEVDGELRFGLPGQPLFPALSGDTDSQADAELAASDQRARQARRRNHLRHGGMSWEADYSMWSRTVPVRGRATLDVIGWITMDNQSGKTFENAHIKLMAGDVSKIQAARQRRHGGAKMAWSQRPRPRVSREDPSTSTISTPWPADDAARPRDQAGRVPAGRGRPGPATLRL